MGTNICVHFYFDQAEIARKSMIAEIAILSAQLSVVQVVHVQSTSVSNSTVLLCPFEFELCVRNVLPSWTTFSPGIWNILFNFTHINYDPYDMGHITNEWIHCACSVRALRHSWWRNIVFYFFFVKIFNIWPQSIEEIFEKWLEIVLVMKWLEWWIWIVSTFSTSKHTRKYCDFHFEIKNDSRGVFTRIMVFKNSL